MAACRSYWHVGTLGFYQVLPGPGSTESTGPVIYGPPPFYSSSLKSRKGARVLGRRVSGQVVSGYRSVVMMYVHSCCNPDSSLGSQTQVYASRSIWINMQEAMHVIPLAGVVMAH